jgi:multiple sugar transport system substrate-binding protein
VLIVVLGLILLLKPDHRGSESGVVDPAWLDASPSGVVRYCSGEDVSHSQQQSVDDFNAEFRGRARAVLDDSASPIADKQHDEYVQTLSEKSQNQCDVVHLDVIYVPEFAQKDLLYDMTPYLRQNGRDGQFNESMMKTVRYKDRLWGVPKHLDAGVLFYRTDKGIKRPRSWQDVFDQAQPQKAGELPRLRFQAAGYEGLTVVFLELAYSAGAQPIISADGKRAEIDQQPAIEAVKFMRHAIGRAVPTGAINQADKGSLYVFETGHALLMRSWPFAAARIKRDADKARKQAKERPRGWVRDHAAKLTTTANHFRVVSLPPWRSGGQSVGILGGQDLVIARNAANPRAALQLVHFLTSYRQVRQDAQDFSLFPVISSVATDPDIDKGTIAAINETSVRPRPAIANYAAVSAIISAGLKRAMASRDGDVGDALRKLDTAVEKMLDKN